MRDGATADLGASWFGAPSGDSSSDTTLDAAAAPFWRMGVNHAPLLFGDDKGNGDKGNGDKGSGDKGLKTYGGHDDVLGTVSDMKAGFLRQIGASDLLWLSLFRDEDDRGRQIPEPSQILANLASATDEFTEACLAAHARGLRIIPTLFTMGGGSDLNDGGKHELVDGLYTDDIDKGIPELGVVFPSHAGWSSWYYAESSVGAEAPSGRVDMVIFERFALQVAAVDPHDDDDVEHDQATSEYARRCALRKRIALVAFGQGVGQALVELDGKLATASGARLTDVVPVLEVGNEFDALWFKSPLDVTETDSDDDDKKKHMKRLTLASRRGARQFGTMHALLAASIRRVLVAAGVPVPKFRLGELSSLVSNPDDHDPLGSRWSEVSDWLVHAVTLGLEREVRAWQGVGKGGAELEELRAEAAAAGIDWPPALHELPDPQDLLQQVGFHWYHFGSLCEQGHGAGPCDGTSFRRTDAQLVEDTATFVERVVDVLSERGYDMSWSVSEVGFPAASNNGDVETDDASEIVQAGMLVRRMALLLASGAEYVGWHTLMSKPVGRDDRKADSPWPMFSALGLRNDVSPTTSDKYDRTTDGYRRASLVRLPSPGVAGRSVRRHRAAQRL